MRKKNIDKMNIEINYAVKMNKYYFSMKERNALIKN